MVEDGDGSVFIYFWVGEKMKAVAIHVKDSILCLSFYDWIRVTLPRMGFAVGCETILLFVLNIYHPLTVRFYDFPMYPMSKLSGSDY